MLLRVIINALMIYTHCLAHSNKIILNYNISIYIMMLIHYEIE